MNISGLVTKCQQKYGKKLYGGNCGTFALALGSYLKDNGIESDVVIFSDFWSEDFDEPSCAADISAAEPRVYHVALSVNGLLYDGDGIVTKDHILDWIESEYDDNEIMVNNFPLESRGMETLINNDTDWSIPASKFYKFINKNG